MLEAIQNEVRMALDQRHKAKIELESERRKLKSRTDGRECYAIRTHIRELEKQIRNSEEHIRKLRNRAASPNSWQKRIVHEFRII